VTTRYLILAAVSLLSFHHHLLGDPPAQMTKQPDVPFAEIDREKLQLDLVIPSGKGPHPCIICWHGGAWKAGSRKDLSTTGGILDFGTKGKSLLEVLAEQGYVAVSPSYRLAPKHVWPAQIIDAKTAIRYLRENAAKYNIDPERIGAMGFSAGGHLAALAGTAQKVPEFEGQLFPKQSSQVKCVVNFFGPADLTLYTETPGIERGFMQPLFGGPSSEKLADMKKASPVNHVSKESVPFMIIHGTLDVVVPIKHSELLHKKLTEAGVPSEFIRMSFKGHGWLGESAAHSVTQSVKFFDKHLKGPK
jgi:acetyl esterase/lipase